jgi:hypothetical protein
MILYSGGPEVPGRWRWCPEGAAVVKVPTAFTSSSWDARDRWESETEVGEVRSSVEWTRPRETNPRLLGVAPCGTAEILAGGATAADVGTPVADAEGVPACCNALEWIGGSEGGGEPDGWPRLDTIACPAVSLDLVFAASPFLFTADQILEQPLVVRLRYDPGSAVWRGRTYDSNFGAVVQVAVQATGPGTIGWGAALGSPASPVTSKAVTCSPLTTGPTGPPAVLTPTYQWARLLDMGPPAEWIVKPIVQVNFETQKQAGDVRIRLADDGFGVPYHMGLYRGDQLLPATLTLPGITEATFPGYARIPLSGLWVQTLTMGRVYLLQHPLVTFAHTFGGNQTIGGWFIVSVSGASRLRWIRPFGSGPILVASPGQTIPVLPQITFRSQYSD